ncbi:hypothetical protein ALP89_03407 [Pseudomonas syringae pv. persicae]|nr:hypothetical protein ALP89_03407 [Pseudomonas syringae pv. persicae]
MAKTNEQLCTIEHCVSMAKTSKHYAVRAKRNGTPRVAATYTQERKHWMNEARRFSL